ncbi:hypothetical protein HYH03_006029 [Edaphochlamys debaryana]|uniref:Uncharacterized protein n=1 Tax=Edaphochlamys debaryana TaxID=47281 RepID=A0A835YDV9_9CHLO|nr:hypothetical protein HYH03_006029 [Edaphochlamys debaryana]|eukprot:KAG2495784.1 hypothetical protein HYH03_006029 [Edaphochlamys debaryana]
MSGTMVAQASAAALAAQAAVTQEALQRCFEGWKHQVALRRLFSFLARGRDQRLLVQVFAAWQDVALAQQTRRTALLAACKRRRNARLVLRGWSAWRAAMAVAQQMEQRAVLLAAGQHARALAGRALRGWITLWAQRASVRVSARHRALALARSCLLAWRQVAADQAEARAAAALLAEAEARAAAALEADARAVAAAAAAAQAQAQRLRGSSASAPVGWDAAGGLLGDFWAAQTQPRQLSLPSEHRGSLQAWLEPQPPAGLQPPHQTRSEVRQDARRSDQAAQRSSVGAWSEAQSQSEPEREVSLVFRDEGHGDHRRSHGHLSDDEAEAAWEARRQQAPEATVSAGAREPVTDGADDEEEALGKEAAAHLQWALEWARDTHRLLRTRHCFRGWLRLADRGCEVQHRQRQLHSEVLAELQNDAALLEAADLLGRHRYLAPVLHAWRALALAGLPARNPPAAQPAHASAPGAPLSAPQQPQPLWPGCTSVSATAGAVAGAAQARPHGQVQAGAGGSPSELRATTPADAAPTRPWHPVEAVPYGTGAGAAVSGASTPVALTAAAAAALSSAAATPFLAGRLCAGAAAGATPGAALDGSASRRPTLSPADSTPPSVTHAAQLAGQASGCVSVAPIEQHPLYVLVEAEGDEAGPEGGARSPAPRGSPVSAGPTPEEHTRALAALEPEALLQVLESDCDWYTDRFLTPGPTPNASRRTTAADRSTGVGAPATSEPPSADARLAAVAEALTHPRSLRTSQPRVDTGGAAALAAASAAPTPQGAGDHHQGSSQGRPPAPWDDEGTQQTAWHRDPSNQGPKAPEGARRDGADVPRAVQWSGYGEVESGQPAELYVQYEEEAPYQEYDMQTHPQYDDEYGGGQAYEEDAYADGAPYDGALDVYEDGPQYDEGSVMAYAQQVLQPTERRRQQQSSQLESYASPAVYLTGPPDGASWPPMGQYKASPMDGTELYKMYVARADGIMRLRGTQIASPVAL